MTNPLRATSYFLESVIIQSPRLEEPYDITNVIGEINLFESLNSPYITGNILLVDSSFLSSEIRFTGEETVTIKVYVDDDYKLEREFIIYSVPKQEKSFNDNVSVYILNIIEKHGFYSYFNRLNKAYSGYINDIIYSIYDTVLFDQTDKAFLNYDNFERPFQNIKVLANNRTPLGLCMSLAKRATNDIGEPFFLYSSLKEGPQFKSLNSLLTGNLMNPGDPFIYTQVQNSTDLKEEKRIVVDMTVGDNDNSIALAKAGALGMRYVSIDPFNKKINKSDYEIDFRQPDYYERKKNAGSVIGENIYDEEFSVGPDDKKLHELNSQIYSEVNTSSGFGQDIKGYDEEAMLSDHLKKVSRRSDMAFLDKQKYSMTIPGHMMFNRSENTSIGRMMEIIVPSDIPLVQKTDESEMKHPKRSGARFLSTKARHRFGLNSHYYVSLEVARLES